MTVTTEALTLSAAEPAIAPGRTYFDGSAIHYLTPSAPERNGPASSLGLPLSTALGAPSWCRVRNTCSMASSTPFSWPNTAT